MMCTLATTNDWTRSPPHRHDRLPIVWHAAAARHRDASARPYEAARGRRPRVAGPEADAPHPVVTALEGGSMNRVLLGALLGVTVGVADVLLMLPLQFQDRTAALLGAFCARFALGFFA